MGGGIPPPHPPPYVRGLIDVTVTLTAELLLLLLLLLFPLLCFSKLRDYWYNIYYPRLVYLRKKAAILDPTELTNWPRQHLSLLKISKLSLNLLL